MSEQEAKITTDVEQTKEEAPAEVQTEEEVKQEQPANEGEGLNEDLNVDDEAETEDLSDEQTIEAAKKAKADGNDLFKDDKLMEALAKYREAVMLIDELDDGETEEAKTLRKTFNLNISTVLK